MKTLFVLISVLISVLHSDAADINIAAVYTVKGELDGAKGHMQGMAFSPGAIYVSHMAGIFKLDKKGKLIKHSNTPVHTGDICYNGGKIYAAVAYYDKARKGKGSIRVYDEDLKEIGKYELENPCDGITVLGDYIYFGIGPSPQKPHRVNHVARIKKDFSGKVEIFDIDHGTPTHYGAQTMCSDGKNVCISFYSAEKNGVSTVFFSPDMKVLETSKFTASIGFDAIRLPEYPNEVVFVRTKAKYKYQKKEPPVLMFEFFRYKDGKMINITSGVKK